MSIAYMNIFMLKSKKLRQLLLDTISSSLVTNYWCHVWQDLSSHFMLDESSMLQEVGSKPRGTICISAAMQVPDCVTTKAEWSKAYLPERSTHHSVDRCPGSRWTPLKFLCFDMFKGIWCLHQLFRGVQLPVSLRSRDAAPEVLEV